MIERAISPADINKLHGQAIAIQEQANSVRKENPALEFVRRSSKAIRFCTDSRWRSMALATALFFTAQADGGYVAFSTAFAGGFLGGHAIQDLIERIGDKNRKNKIINRTAKGEKITSEDMIQALRYNPDIPSLRDLYSWLKGYETISLLGDPRAVFLLSMYNAKRNIIDKEDPVKSSKRKQLKNETKSQLIFDALTAISKIQEERQVKEVMKKEIIKNLSFTIGEGLVMLGAAITIDRLFHNTTYTSFVSVADDIPTIIAIAAVPYVEKLAKLVSYPTLLKIINKKPMKLG